MKKIIAIVLILFFSSVCIAEDKKWYSPLRGEWKIETLRKPNDDLLSKGKALFKTDEFLFYYNDDTWDKDFYDSYGIFFSETPFVFTLFTKFMNDKDYYLIVKKDHILMLPEEALKAKTNPKAVFVYYKIYR